LSFNHTTGRLEIEGSATVSASGKFVLTDPGTGLTHPGWSGLTPPGTKTCPTPPPPPPRDNKEPGDTEEDDLDPISNFDSSEHGGSGRSGAGSGQSSDSPQTASPGTVFYYHWKSKDKPKDPNKPRPPAGECPPPPQPEPDKKTEYTLVDVEVEGPLAEFMKEGDKSEKLQSYHWRLEAGDGQEKTFSGDWKSYAEIFKRGEQDALRIKRRTAFTAPS
jgi:hypothetical protein